jgi:cyanate lyase
VRSKLRGNDSSKVEAELQEFFTAYDDAISNIDFKLDTEKVKRDILKITGKFLKKRKL